MAYKPDTWRQRVYDAEGAWKRTLTLDQKDHLGHGAAQLLCDELADHFGVSRVTYRYNGRLKAAGAWYKRSQKLIETSSNYRHATPKSTIVHEFAHHLDYERRGDGKGHGGSFVSAMIDLVDHVYGRESRGNLIRAYEAEGVPTSLEESIERTQRAARGIDRRRDRHGAIEEAWSLRMTTDYGVSFWINQNKEDLEHQLSRAGVWKRRSSVEKIVERESKFWSSEYRFEVVKVMAELDTKFTNRWWAFETIEEESV